ncbi:MAG TPA: LamB/YcsF family protein, partial [Savagea sp.]
EAIAQAVKDVSPSLVLYGLAGSELTKAGEKLGLTVAHEVFADRTYQPDGTLTPRTEANALITDEQQSLDQIRQMVMEGTVRAVDGTIVELQADTICVHGDSPHAVTFASRIYDDLRKSGVNVQPFIP